MLLKYHYYSNAEWAKEIMKTQTPNKHDVQFLLDYYKTDSYFWNTPKGKMIIKLSEKHGLVSTVSNDNKKEC